METPADKLVLSVVTPQREVLRMDAAWVDIPAESGQMRALPQHAPTLGALGAGVVRWEASAGGAAQQLAVTGGFFEVLGDKVTLLADAVQAETNTPRRG